MSNAPDTRDMETTQMLMPAIIREHAATMQGVLTFWREVAGDMHCEAQKAEDTIDSSLVDCWIEKLDFLLKAATDAGDDLARRMREAGYTRQLPSGGANLGQWQAPG